MACTTQETAPRTSVSALGGPFRSTQSTPRPQSVLTMTLLGMLSSAVPFCHLLVPMKLGQSQGAHHMDTEVQKGQGVTNTYSSCGTKINLCSSLSCDIYPPL